MEKNQKKVGDSMQQLNLGNILQQFEQSEFAMQKELTKDEYILLYGFSEGFNNFDMMDLMECSRSTMLRLQRTLLKKVGAKNKIHAVCLFAKGEF